MLHFNSKIFKQPLSRNLKLSLKLICIKRHYSKFLECLAFQRIAVLNLWQDSTFYSVLFNFKLSYFASLNESWVLIYLFYFIFIYYFFQKIEREFLPQMPYTLFFGSMCCIHAEILCLFRIRPGKAEAKCMYASNSLLVIGKAVLVKNGKLHFFSHENWWCQ